MPTTRYLGNDIVALTSPRCRGKIEDRRFLQRILTPEDEAFVFSTPDPETALWISWAGKEALFKSTTKMLGSPPVFDHRRFSVAFPAEELLERTRPFTLKGTASYHQHSVLLEAEVQHGFVHVLAWREGTLAEDSVSRRPDWSWSSWDEEGEGTLKELLQLLSPGERDCASHRTSALTRLAARSSLAETLGLDEDRLELRCGAGNPGRRVPLLFLDGRKVQVDLSLSHDAQLMAWAWDGADLRGGVSP